MRGSTLELEIAKVMSNPTTLHKLETHVCGLQTLSMSGSTHNLFVCQACLRSTSYTARQNKVTLDYVTTGEIVLEIMLLKT